MFEEHGLLIIALAFALFAAIVVCIKIDRIPLKGDMVKIGNIPYDKKFFVYKRDNEKIYSRIGARIHVQVVLCTDGKAARVGATEKIDPKEKVQIIN